MARPIVLVFQELANLSFVPTVADLNTIIVGPAYVINDYPDDSANILLTDTYGELDQPSKTAGDAVAYNPPVANVTEITVNSYPNNEPGAVVDHDSVLLYLRTPRVVLGSTYLASDVAPVLGVSITTDNATPDVLNKIEFTSLVDLPEAGITSGDIILLTDSAGNTLKRTVLSVGEAGTADNVLRVTQNLPTASGWTFDANGGARIERQLVTQLVEDTDGLILVFPEPSDNQLLIKGGIKLPVTIASAVVDRTVSYAQGYLAYRALRQDLQGIDSCNSTEITTKVGKIDARNPLAVGLSVALQNSGSVEILFYGVESNDIQGHAKFRDAVSSRKDIYAIVPLTADRDIIFSYKIDCDTLADPTIASDTGVEQKFRVVIGNGTLPEEENVSPSSTEATPQQSGASTGKYRTVIINAPGAADITAAIPGDTVTIGLVPVGAFWSGRRGTHYISHVNEPSPGDTNVFELVPTNVAWDDDNPNDSGTTPGDEGVEIRIKDRNNVILYEKLASFDFVFGASTLTIAHRNPVVSGGPYTVTFVSGASTVASISGFDITLTYGAGATVDDAITAIAAAVDVNAVVTTELTGPGTDVLSPVASTPLEMDAADSGLEIDENDDLFDILQDDDATFLTSGVLPGDVVEIPANPNDYSNDAFDGIFTSYVIEEVISENRLKLTPATDDTQSIATEFPHGYSRSGSGSIDVTTPLAIRYRVQRILTKDDQVTALIAYSQSFFNKRCTLVWPDLAIVSGLKDGSLPRSSPLVLQSADPQPGYYIACAVGGACAGLPPQQGLTNLGFAGLESVIHATDYFKDTQLTQISDGGWFVLQQDNPIAAPYCIHQLTTDVTAVETGEFSVVKTVDFVSVFLAGILRNFIGRYNVTEDALSDIAKATNQGIENLKSRKVARIGAPLIDGKITSLVPSTISSDRVEIYVDINVPRPLNRIGLHLVV